MPRVITTVDLADLAELDVWPTLVNFERYPDLMEDVVRVQVLERSETSMVSSWEVLLNGSQFTWTERDTLTAPRLIEFEQIDGDLEVWKGKWELLRDGDNLSAALTVDFDIGIPSLSEILDPIGERAIRANCRQMLDAIRQHASEPAEC